MFFDSTLVRRAQASPSARAMGLHWRTTQQGEVRGGGFPRALRRREQKHLWVILLRRLEREGPLTRDFAFEYRWTRSGRETRRCGAYLSELGNASMGARKQASNRARQIGLFWGPS